MAFFVTVLWAMFSFVNPGFSHSAGPVGGGFSAPTSVQGVHHASGGKHTMDSSIGGPA